MGFQVITLTDAAASRINEIVANKGEDALGIRVSIKKGGCAGMEYAVDLVTSENANDKDDFVEHAGAKVWVDPAAALYLLGTQMDFEVTKLRTGFVFNNPNESSACGCGESVELKAADLAELARAREAAAH
ncbi:Fe-S cluster assembly scaffold SufA [Martelella mediterranea]|uniref:Iron-sulfur cluster assembly protein n=1 Tax=Martelella mediterranea TaxID=293089 RepID=A0A4R3NTZ2_9HYPH|nr:Fe-S cluster assembly scaffold SufA [Martelella mediterranea]TCT40879.1 iron-sulfur cluster assembly protein [Martelella mediterranea]